MDRLEALLDWSPPSAELLAAMDRARAAEERADAEDRLRDVPLPPRTKLRIVHSTLDATEALDAIQRWEHETRPIAVLLGPHGVGKTTAASAAAHLLKRHPTYIRSRHLARIYRAEFGDEQAEFGGLTKRPLVIVDEIGRELSRELASQALLEIVDERGSRERPTILLSNLDKRAFMRHVGTAVESRLAEMGHVVEVGGQDLRRS